jgi:hypothetical protein
VMSFQREVVVVGFVSPCDDNWHADSTLGGDEA